jgi:hypothetical protein
MVIMTRSDCSCSDIALTNCSSRCWTLRIVFIMSVWHCLAPEVSIPSRHVYKGRWTKFTVPRHDCHNYVVTWQILNPCCTKTDFCRTALREFQRLFSVLAGCSNELGRSSKKLDLKKQDYINSGNGRLETESKESRTDEVWNGKLEKKCTCNILCHLI